jgi:hypothetical protein
MIQLVFLLFLIFRIVLENKVKAALKAQLKAQPLAQALLERNYYKVGFVKGGNSPSVFPGLY